MKEDSSKNKKYIFLDTDGTLNTGHWHSIEDINKWADKDDFIYYEPAVKNLAKIIEATGAEIISLFNGYRRPTIENWELKKLPGKAIAGIFRLEIKDKLEDLININNEVITGFAIIDFTDEGLLPEHRSHLVAVNPEIGITQTDAEKAINILNMRMNINDEKCIEPIDYHQPFSVNTSAYIGKLFDKLIHGSIKDNHSNDFLIMHLYGPVFGEKIYYRDFKDSSSNEHTKVTITDNGIQTVTDLSILHDNDVNIILSFQHEKLIIQSTGLESFGFNKYYSIDLEKIDTGLTKDWKDIHYYTDVVFNKEHGIDHELVPYIIDVEIKDDLIDTLEFHYYHKGVHYRLLLMMNSGLSNRSANNGSPEKTDGVDEDYPY